MLKPVRQWEIEASKYLKNKYFNMNTPPPSLENGYG